jgi:methylenetetrahydrofolate reductase (NADPH)
MTGDGPPGRGLRAALATGAFAVTAEIGPPRGVDPERLRRKAAALAGWVDAANLTDNAGANVRVSSLAAASVVAAAGVEPVMQLTCRDRNRMALQSDLIAAGLLGIPNVLLLTGDHPRFGDHADAAPVFDLDSVQLVWAARGIRDDGRLMSGATVEPRPRWLIGAVENPFAPPRAFRATRLGKKVAAGIDLVQTQFVFDIDAFRGWTSQVRDLGLDRRCAVLAGVGPLRSVRALDFVSSRVPGVWVPEHVRRRLRGVRSGRVAAEGMLLAVETVQQLREIPGVAGVHLMAFGNEQLVPEILGRAGLPPRTVAGPPAAGTPVAGGTRAD